MSRLIKIGTRGSRLALWQAHKVQSELAAIGFSCELVIIKTQGDEVQNLSFDKLEGKGFFTKEIEDALLASDIDVAVHSLKDLPTEQPEGLSLAGLSTRANPSDVLLIHPESHDASRDFGLKEGSIIGTSSIRRKTQILSFLPEVQVLDLRGNVPTRVQKLRDKAYDAIILAAAGLDRLELDLSDLVAIRMHPKEFVPAPAQGVIAYQVRSEDKELRKIIAQIHDPETAAQTNIERKVLKLMQGGCQMPLGVYCDIDNASNYHVYAAFAKEADKPLIKINLSQSTQYLLAEKVVEMLLSNGSTDTSTQVI